MAQQVDVESLIPRLQEIDPRIIEIIQLGSSIYMPDMSNDIDFAVILDTEYIDQSYLSYLIGKSVEINKELGIDTHHLFIANNASKMEEEFTKEFSLGLLSAGKLIYGKETFLDTVKILNNLDTLLDAARDRSKHYFQLVNYHIRLARRCKPGEWRETRLEWAFGCLFYASRVAYLYHRLLTKGFPEEDVEKCFKTIVVKCHINKEFSMDEFPAWRRNAVIFVSLTLRSMV